MNAFDMARTAYTTSNIPVSSPQRTEYEAIARVTRNLNAATAEGADFRDTVTALHENRRLWKVLAVSVAEDENALPADLRARIFYLAEFTFHSTRKILRKEMSVQSLVDINTAVMRGLRGQESNK